MRTETIQTDIMAQVKKIEPVIRKHSFEAEKNRRLSQPVLKALKDSRMFRIWKPEAYDGLETDPITGFEVLEELSKIDSAVGWGISDQETAWFEARKLLNKALELDPNNALVYDRLAAGYHLYEWDFKRQMIISILRNK